MKVLILSISDFSGHRSVADAIEQELRSADPSIVVCNENFFHYLPQSFVRKIDAIYYAMLDKKPALWHGLRENKWLALWIKVLQVIFYLVSGMKIYRKLIKEFKPDYIICTQAYPCNVMGYNRRLWRQPYRLGAVITDYNMNAYWLNPYVDDYFLASQQMKKELELKVSAKVNLHSMGIPIRSMFANSRAVEDFFEKDVWDPHCLTLLMMGGSLGMGAYLSWLNTLLADEAEIRVLVVTGRNQKLQQDIERYYGHDKRVLTLGFMDHIAELMCAAHVLVSKPGGVTMAEALAVGIPIVSINPLAGQEQVNQDFLKNYYHVDVALTPKDLLLLCRQKRSYWVQLAKQTHELGFPLATQDLVAFILSSLT